MKLTVCEDILIITNPSNSEILGALVFLQEGFNPAFAILEVNDMTYLQVSGDSKNGFCIEYQEGKISQHYRATRKATLEEAVNIFISYRDNKDKWNLSCPIYFSLD